MKKLIGIVAEEETPSSSAFKALRFFTNSYYTGAVEKAGGIPVLIMRSEFSKELVSHLDGVLFQGGMDVDPSSYHEEIQEKCGAGSIEEDDFQISIALAAAKEGKKVLGICRGLQILNTAFGGTLIQDLNTSISHTRLDAPSDPVHEIIIKNGTLLHSLFKEDTINVNSLHHQAVKTPAHGFMVSAVASDGTIEAIERGHILAVQWHPEALRLNDERMDVLFSWLVR
jgi:Predicted glutamine amidotransferases